MLWMQQGPSSADQMKMLPVAERKQTIIMLQHKIHKNYKGQVGTFTSTFCS